MAVLCICCAFRVWVAPFISDNNQLVRKRSVGMPYKFQFVSFPTSIHIMSDFLYTSLILTMLHTSIYSVHLWLSREESYLSTAL